MAINFIAKLYTIEKEARQSNLNFEERCELRQDKSLSILIKFKQWLDDSIDTVPPRSPIGQAISYTLKHWDNLINYVDNGEVEIDNNLIENWIRTFALGRKNCYSMVALKALNLVQLYIVLYKPAD